MLLLHTRSVDNFPSQLVAFGNLRLGRDERNELDSGGLVVLAGFSERTVFVVGVIEHVGSEHFRLWDQIEGFTNGEDGD